MEGPHRENRKRLARPPAALTLPASETCAPFLFLAIIASGHDQHGLAQAGPRGSGLPPPTYRAAIGTANDERWLTDSGGCPPSDS